MIESAWYRERFGHLFQLSSDANLQYRFENDHTGVRLATSVGGSATGEGGTSSSSTTRIRRRSHIPREHASE